MVNAPLPARALLRVQISWAWRPFRLETLARLAPWTPGTRPEVTGMCLVQHPRLALSAVMPELVSGIQSNTRLRPWPLDARHNVSYYELNVSREYVRPHLCVFGNAIRANSRLSDDRP
jgi:hypothetical protein